MSAIHTQWMDVDILTVKRLEDDELHGNRTQTTNM